MATDSAASAMAYAFDDRKIRWYLFGEFKHFVFAVLDVDEERRIVDLILKFEANQRIFIHRHRALTNTLSCRASIACTSRMEPLKEIRPVGAYTSSPPGEPHF
jgi:hypothetical protein